MKLLKKLLILIIICLIIISTFLLLSGYVSYSNMLKEQSISSRIEEIRNKEDFTTYDELAEDYINAVVAVEDHRFFDHGAIDIISIGRAMVTNIKKQEFAEGGSTITQQVAKNVCFTQERSAIRKIAETFAAFELEKNYSKEEIFEIYVNTSYFGEGYYCIYDASQGYYDKDPKNLSLDEASMLAGVPNAPSVYAPTVNPDLAKKRQKHVLNKMVEYGYITQKEIDKIE